jgi:hypothetical protein
MADPVAAALTLLANAITAMNANNAASTAAANAAALSRNTPTVDFFDNNLPFDLATRAGGEAFKQACLPLDLPWDGAVDTLPAFIIALKIRTKEIRLNAAAPYGILDIEVAPGTTATATAPATPAITRNILTEYNRLSEVQIEAARVARTDQQAIQNAKAFYKLLKGSITGDIKTTIFDQVENIPAFEDGNMLFKKITTFTVAASLQLSMMALNTIITYDPTGDEFKVSDINKKLNHLFVLARSPT